ncbi:hypothetical protein TeGR_g1123 [Tetraparma gracilis]|uniref:Receptor ligand binding region domain-containing protein n=1 Tax=Tetraparma gracilis TaxID=2962635 RepID=A0ABQ6NBM9_9STRA|nr:hypothetical protein TeGR_g1123 [Tetraparma gracilis]
MLPPLSPLLWVPLLLLLLPSIADGKETECPFLALLTTTALTFSDCATVLLPFWDFLNKNCAVVPDLCEPPYSDSNITATPNIQKDDQSASTATRVTLEWLNQTCAMTGPSWSSLTVPVATVTGTVPLPQMGSATTSVLLDDPARYPSYGRTITSDATTASYAVDFFTSLGVGKVCVVHREDEWGDQYSYAFLEAAREATPPIAAVSFVQREGVAEKMEEEGCQNFFAAVFDFDHLHDSGGSPAADAGLNSEANMWLFGDGVGEEELLEIWPLSAGYGMITATGYVAGLPQSEKLRAHWEAQGTNFANYVRGFAGCAWNPLDVSELPPTDYFQTTPSLYTGVQAFEYDAVMAVLLGASKQDANGGFNETNLADTNNNGKSVLYERTINMDFLGASGRVAFSTVTGTRSAETVVTGIYNMQNAPASAGSPSRSLAAGLPAFPLVSSKSFGSPWSSVAGLKFIFPNGLSTIAPQIYPPLVEMNYIPDSFALIGIILMALTMLLTLALAAWILWFKNDQILKASQPMFLLTILAGTFVYERERSKRKETGGWLRQKRPESRGASEASKKKKALLR